MNRLFLALLFLLCSALAFGADAKFKVGEITFVYTVREGATTYDLVVLVDNNEIYQGWTLGPDSKSVIVEDIDDDKIMAKGSRRGFIEWGLAEAKRRAIEYVNASKPAAPDPNRKMDSVVWNIRYNLTSTPAGVVIPAAPLP